MSRTVYEINVIDDHMKLFMLSAHYLHKIHGKLDTKDITSDGQGSNLKKQFIDSLNRTTLSALLNEFDIDVCVATLAH